MAPSRALSLAPLLNGPNLNTLGLRQPEVSGSAAFAVGTLRAEAAERLGPAIGVRQTSGERELVGWIAKRRRRAPRAPSSDLPPTPQHRSHSMDALLAVGPLAVEGHVTDIHRREKLRKDPSGVEPAVGVIAGLGTYGYAPAYTARMPMLERGA